MASEKTRQLFVNSFLNVSSYSLGLVLNFLLIPFIIHRVGVDYYGLYAIILGVSAPLTLANLGFGEATIKFVAENLAAGNQRKAAGYVSNTLFLNAVVGLAGFFAIWLYGTDIVLLFNKNLGSAKTETLRQCFLIAGFLWLSSQLTSVFIGIPVAAQRYVFIAVGNLLNSLLLPLTSFLFLSVQTNLLYLMYATLTTALLLLLYWSIVSARILGSGIFMPRYHRESFADSYRFGAWQALSQIGGILTSQMEKFLVLRYLGDRNLGFYNSALGLESKLMTVIYKISEVLFPFFAAETGNSQTKKADQLILTSWIITLLTCMVLLPLIPLANDFMGLWLGAESSTKSYKVLQYMLVAGSVGTIVTPAYFFLLGNGKTKATAIQSLASGLVTILCAIVLLPRYGMSMAAMPMIIGTSMQLVVVTFALRYTSFSAKATRNFLLVTAVPWVLAVASGFMSFKFKFFVADSWLVLLLAYGVYSTAIFLLLATLLMVTYPLAFKVIFAKTLTYLNLKT